MVFLLKLCQIAWFPLRIKYELVEVDFAKSLRGHFLVYGAGINRAIRFFLLDSLAVRPTRKYRSHVPDFVFDGYDTHFNIQSLVQGAQIDFASR